MALHRLFDVFNFGFQPHLVIPCFLVGHGLIFTVDTLF